MARDFPSHGSSGEATTATTRSSCVFLDERLKSTHKSQPVHTSWQSSRPHWRTTSLNKACLLPLGYANKDLRYSLMSPLTAIGELTLGPAHPQPAIPIGATTAMTIAVMGYSRLEK